MHVSRETAEQTHRRLLHVIAAADFRIHDGTFAYSEYRLDDFPRERAHEALALVRDEDVWSVLAAARADESEPLGVLSFHFPAHLDNSGFVGWLATHLKARLGTGVAVVCGSNAARGGIFDYWAAPRHLFSAVVAEIDRLRQRGAVSPDNGRLDRGQEPQFDLDGAVMQVTSTASNGVVDARTRITFRQRGTRVLGRYAGGDVRRGCLVGNVCGDRLTFRYAQAETAGAIQAGRSLCELGRQRDGRLRIIEHFCWSTRRGSGTNVFDQVA